MHELPATFGKYYLTEKLATGGMAEIYLGKILGPAGFEKQLVIKQIHPRLTGQRHFVDLFVAEAKTLVGLAHGNIVPVYELGVVDDVYYIAMEYIDGPTLYRLTEAAARGGRRLEPALAAWIAAEILDGLDYAHRKGDGIIHRDLSPRNVMLSRDGEVKLVDFGIAVGFSDGGAAEIGGEGVPTGSFPYMSPEQVRRERLTGQSDLFSVAVLLWEMLTGRRLFARASADQTLAAVTDAPIVAPSTLAPAVPPALDAAVLRGLARETGARWATAADFGAALNRFLYGQEPLPGARDLAVAVARYCPPERIADGGATAVELEPATHATAADEPDTAARAPRTAAIARPRRPRRPRRRSPRPVAWARRRSTPAASAARAPCASRASRPTSRSSGCSSAPRRCSRWPRSATCPTSTPAMPPRPRRRPRGPSSRRRAPTSPRRSPRAPRPGSPRWGAWLAVAIAAAAIALAVWWIRRGEAPVVGFPGDAGARAIGVSAIDAGPPDAARADAAPAPDAADAPPPPLADARRADPPDAAPGPRDAGPRVPSVDARAAAAGTARLIVGADPWGEVSLDGAPLGRAPGAWTVPAGPHDVEVVLPVDPPQRQRFHVDLAAGGSAKLFAPFTP